MVEQLRFAQQAEQKVEYLKVVKLTPTKTPVGISDSSEKTHPVFLVRLFQNDTRLIQNMKMQVISCSYKSCLVVLEFEELLDNFIHKFKIDQVKSENNQVLIGSDIQIACRDITYFNQAIFWMSVAKDIKVRSKERMLS